MDTRATSSAALIEWARLLECTAGRLEGSLAMKVHCRAGDPMWRGGLAETCDRDLEQVRGEVAWLMTALRTEAQRCRQAAALPVTP
jgi:hypothetical protein